MCKTKVADLRRFGGGESRGMKYNLEPTAHKKRASAIWVWPKRRVSVAEQEGGPGRRKVGKIEEGGRGRRKVGGVEEKGG